VYRSTLYGFVIVAGFERACAVRWSGGQVVRWSGGQVVRWSGGQVVRWSGGQVVRWSGGQVGGLCGGMSTPGVQPLVQCAWGMQGGDGLALLVSLMAGFDSRVSWMPGLHAMA
jgi:hypothetical protein